MGECKHGNNEWSCLNCEVELLKNVISELERKLADSEGRAQRLSVKYRYEREVRVPKLEEEIKRLKREIIEAFHNWALGNFDDERFHADIQILVHNLENEE